MEPNPFIEERKEVVSKIDTAITSFIDQVNPELAFKKSFHGIKMSYCGAPLINNITMKLFRVLEWQRRPKLIAKTTYNPKGPLERCNLDGKPAMYLTNCIVPGIMETIVRSKEKYFEEYNDLFPERRFILHCPDFFQILQR